MAEERTDIQIRNDGYARSGNQYVAFLGDFSTSGGPQIMQIVHVKPNTGYRVSLWVSGTPGLVQDLNPGAAGGVLPSLLMGRVTATRRRARDAQQELSQGKRNALARLVTELKRAFRR
jgi:hypothetical protein